MKHLFIFSALSFLLLGCGNSKVVKNENKGSEPQVSSAYEGTASISQGLGLITAEHIYQCERGRKTDQGIITSTDAKQWILPASNNFISETFPFVSDLYNDCNGKMYATGQEAISKLDGSDIIEIDADAPLYTAYIFADNYFEMYINGTPAGKDKVPFTTFNSSIVRFKVTKPFTIAMKLIDWEEGLGIGTEKGRGSDFHPGDGGMVLVIKDKDQNTIAITDEHWKAQTYYTAPIKDLSCVSEIGSQRISRNCDDSDSDDGTSFFGLHWDLPTGWEESNFDDSDWPDASTYTNETIGVDNKKSYTNFIDIFDDTAEDAQFIWSTNIILDNEVLVRHTVN